MSIQTQVDYLDDWEFYQTEEWMELRDDILERDGFRCRVCGASGNLRVHHIIPRKYKYIAGFDIDSPANLITLCDRHHTMADRKVDKYGNKLEVEECP